MTNYMKAVKLMAYMARVHRPAVYLQVDDVLKKTSKEELDFYYRWCCHVL